MKLVISFSQWYFTAIGYVPLALYVLLKNLCSEHHCALWGRFFFYRPLVLMKQFKCALILGRQGVRQSHIHPIQL